MPLVFDLTYMETLYEMCYMNTLALLCLIAISNCDLYDKHEIKNNRTCCTEE